jgi:hypothetical protein
MTTTPGRQVLKAVRAIICVAACAPAGACVSAAKLNPLAFGGVDQTSAVAADVEAAERSPGPYPRFSKLPPPPKDVRPAIAWRSAVADELALKAKTEHETAAIPFTLGDTDAWAANARSRVSADQAHGAPADTAEQTEAFAAAERARATPPSQAK